MAQIKGIEEFQPKTTIIYPPYSSGPMIEQAVHEANINIGQRRYLPIYWTNYYCANGYSKGNHSRLHAFLESLPDDKYWTVCQYDDGVLDKRGKDILVFSSGGVGDIALPLLANPMPMRTGLHRDLMYSFNGSRTHQLRVDMVEYFASSNVTFQHVSPDEYLRRMERSVFSLCPRGYGKTSFRLYEAIHLGSIPIYLSDDHWLPYSDIIDWTDFCILGGSAYGLIEAMEVADIKSYTDSLHDVAGFFTMDFAIDYIKHRLR